MTGARSAGRLVGADALTWMERVRTAPGEPQAQVDLVWERSRALRALERESDSFLRLGAGLAAFALWCLALAGLAAALWDGAAVGVRVVGGLVAAAAGVAAVLGGLAVWRAGRAVVTAYCWWTLLPERLPEGVAVAGWRDDAVRDVVLARVFVFSGWRPLRIGLGAAAALAPAAFVALAVEGGPRYTPTWHEGQGAALTAVVVGLVIAGLMTAAVVLGGQFRAAAAHSERDPIWRRITGRSR